MSAPRRRGARLALAFIVAMLPSLGLAQAYDPVFASYQSYKTERSEIDWREANRSAGELGGFVGQVRASRPASVAPSAATRSPATPESIPSMAETMKSMRKSHSTAAPEPGK